MLLAAAKGAMGASPGGICIGDPGMVGIACGMAGTEADRITLGAIMCIACILTVLPTGMLPTGMVLKGAELTCMLLTGMWLAEACSPTGSSMATGGILTGDPAREERWEGGCEVGREEDPENEPLCCELGCSQCTANPLLHLLSVCLCVSAVSHARAADAVAARAAVAEVQDEAAPTACGCACGEYQSPRWWSALRCLPRCGVLAKGASWDALVRREGDIGHQPSVPVDFRRFSLCGVLAMGAPSTLARVRGVFASSRRSFSVFLGVAAMLAAISAALALSCASSSFGRLPRRDLMRGSQ
mmetsp:Transcript_133440/g.231921  ORF Transcript_133440/g.231921 Transcript_133440/m.231921 type:complete len:300 (-) Transcript_133440:676-1575(-)